jgi:uncharacterized protein
MSLSHYESLIAGKIAEVATAADPAHDILHFRRVVRTAKALCLEENAKMEVVMPAAWLHDLVNVPKNDPRRKQASKLSAIAAIEFLESIQYPQQYFEDIAHAIEAHSFSANIEAKTIEAKIVQDADRLDGLGAIGIARCFASAGVMKRAFYSEQDPFCEKRAADDLKFTVDHFYVKLFKVSETLQTAAGRREGIKRAEIMRKFLADLKLEI